MEIKLTFTSSHALSLYLDQVGNAYKNGIGFDLRATERTSIRPYETGAKVQTGIKIAIPDGYAGIIKDRSSVALDGLVTVAGVIDPSYRGEISIIFNNHKSKYHYFEEGERIAQLLIYHAAKPTITITDQLDSTTRGENGFGSTGRM